MRGTLARLAPVLHLTRVTTAFGAVANSWFVVLWTRATPAEQAGATGPLLARPLWLELAGSAACSVGLFAFAMALNDLLDRRRDSTIHPERPLPSGRLTGTQAAILLASLLAISLAGAALMGWPAVWMALGTAAAAIAYNTAAKFVPSAGLVLIGLIYGAQMMTPNVHLAFVWPVWWAMTHALLVGALTHKAAERRPVITTRVKVFAVSGWAFWSLVLLTVGFWRGGLWPAWVSPAASFGPAVLGIGFYLLGQSILSRPGPAHERAASVQRAGALWLPLYASAWMFGQGYNAESLLFVGLAAAGLLGMTVLKEVYGLIEHPVGFVR